MKQKWTTGWERTDGKMIYTQIILSLFFPPAVAEYFIFYRTPQIHLDCGGKKNWPWRKQREQNLIPTERGPSIFPPKHTEALHLSPGPPLSWILLYVNSMYLRSLEGNTASATDSEMLHFSPLTKGKRPVLAPPVLHPQNGCWTGSFFQPVANPSQPLTHPPTRAPYLSLSLLGAFQELYNEKKTTAILQTKGRASSTAATRYRDVITLADHEGDDPLAN